LRKIGESNILTFGTPIVNDQAVQITERFGFQQVSSCKRMYFGQELMKYNPKGIFAIGDSEKG